MGISRRHDRCLPVPNKKRQQERPKAEDRSRPFKTTANVGGGYGAGSSAPSRSKMASILKLLPHRQYAYPRPSNNNTTNRRLKKENMSSAGQQQSPSSSSASNVERWLESQGASHQKPGNGIHSRRPDLDGQEESFITTNNIEEGTISPLALDSSPFPKAAAQPLLLQPQYTTMSKSTYQLPHLVPLPQQQQSSSSSQPSAAPALARLRAAVKSARDAETLHAYDVGVTAALQSMLLYWNSRADAMETSTAERRIFLREAQRLTELMDDAEREMLISNAELVERQEEEERVWRWLLLEGPESSAEGAGCEEVDDGGVGSGEGEEMGEEEEGKEGEEEGDYQEKDTASVVFASSVEGNEDDDEFVDMDFGDMEGVMVNRNGRADTLDRDSEGDDIMEFDFEEMEEVNSLGSVSGIDWLD